MKTNGKKKTSERNAGLVTTLNRIKRSAFCLARLILLYFLSSFYYVGWTHVLRFLINYSIFNDEENVSMADKISTESNAELVIDRKKALTVPHQDVPKRPPEVRVKDYNEVYTGYTPELAKIEGSRCIQCPTPQPCVLGCPLHNDIPLAMWRTSHGDFAGAIEAYHRTSSLSFVCGRVCPQERLCQGSCVVGKVDEYPVYIGKIEAFLADNERINLGGFEIKTKPPSGQRVAIVGAGPAGLTVAVEMLRQGHEVVMYDAWPKPGGLLVYGIPNFKLQKELVKDLTDRLEAAGMQFIGNTMVGKDIMLTELYEKFDAIFLGTGAGVPSPLKVPRLDYHGVYKAIDYLVGLNLSDDYLPEGFQRPDIEGKRIVVVGGGDTAMDCVRSSLRANTASVTCVYRRMEAQMPGRPEERRFAKEEGAKFEFLTQPIRIIGDENDNVTGMECIRMKLGEPDESGRRRPIPVEGSNFVVETDVVVLALGFWPDPLLGKTTPQLKTHDWGLITIDPDTGETTLPGVYAGGDNTNGADLVVTAAAAASKAARSMKIYLEERRQAGRSVLKGDGHERVSTLANPVK